MGKYIWIRICEKMVRYRTANITYFLIIPYQLLLILTRSCTFYTQRLLETQNQGDFNVQIAVPFTRHVAAGERMHTLKLFLQISNCFQFDHIPVENNTKLKHSLEFHIDSYKNS